MTEKTILLVEDNPNDETLSVMWEEGKVGRETAFYFTIGEVT